jgi:hypothetical protein
MKICVYVGYSNNCLDLDIAPDDYNDMEENEGYKEWKNVDKMIDEDIKEIAKDIEVLMVELAGDGYELEYVDMTVIDDKGDEEELEIVDMLVGKLVRYLVSPIRMNSEM